MQIFIGSRVTFIGVNMGLMIVAEACQFVEYVSMLQRIHGHGHEIVVSVSVTAVPDDPAPTSRPGAPTPTQTGRAAHASTPQQRSETNLSKNKDNGQDGNTFRLPSTPSPSCVTTNAKKRIHAEQVKKERVALKKDLDNLKAQLPSAGENQKMTTLKTLTTAMRLIQELEENSRRYQEEINLENGRKKDLVHTLADLAVGEKNGNGQGEEMMDTT